MPSSRISGHHSRLAFYRHLLCSLSRHLAAVQSLRAKAHGVCRHSAGGAPLCWISNPWELVSMPSSMVPQTNCVTMPPNSMASRCVLICISHSRSLFTSTGPRPTWHMNVNFDLAAKNRPHAPRVPQAHIVTKFKSGPMNAPVSSISDTR